MRILHSKVKKIHKAELSMIAFSSLGVSCILSGSMALMPIGVIMSLAMPFALSGLMNRHVFSKVPHYSSCKNGFGYYSHFITKEMTKYIEEPIDLLGRKYRLIFLSMWSRNYDFNLDNIDTPKLWKSIEELNDAIAINNISQYDLTKLFMVSNKKNEKIKFYIEEDINNNQRIDVAKKIYKDFENEGFLGRELRYYTTPRYINFLLKLQDYKLTPKDIMEIKEQIRLSRGNTFDKFDYQLSEELTSLYLQNEEYADVLKEYLKIRNDEYVLEMVEKIDLKRRLDKQSVNEKEMIIKRNKI